MGGPQYRSGRYREEKSLHLERLELRTLGSPLRSQSLCQMSYHTSIFLISYFVLNVIHLYLVDVLKLLIFGEEWNLPFCLNRLNSQERVLSKLVFEVMQQILSI
jgi:hypothetical protein